MPGYEEIGCHMVFDIKMDGKFTRKARYVTNDTLNDLEVLSCDITNAYLNADCREKIWVQAGPEFGEDEDLVMIIKKALYCLKSSGASWRNMISQTMLDAGYENTYADPDVWRRRAVKNDGTHYYELILVYVDDIMSISQIPQKTMDMIGKLYDLKDSFGEPERYLRVNLKKWTLQDGREVWSASGKEYIKNALPLVKSMAEAHHSKLPGEKSVLKDHSQSLTRLNSIQQHYWVMRNHIRVSAIDTDLTMGSGTWTN
eukprot:scaffold38581_cov48-Attheya_sp.AAC.3